MANSGVCRLCLAVDVPMHTIAGSLLQIVYEKLTSIKLHTADRRPLEACYICYAQLKRSYMLMRTARAAHKALTEILYKYNEVTKQSVAQVDRESIGLSGFLTFSRIDYYDTTLPDKIEIKIEVNLEDVCPEDAGDTEMACDDSRVEIELEPTIGEHGDIAIEHEQTGLLATDAIKDSDTSHNADDSNCKHDPLILSCNADVDTKMNEEDANDGEPEEQPIEEKTHSRKIRRRRKNVRARTTESPPHPSADQAASATELQRSLHECTICQIQFTRSTSLQRHLRSNTHERVIKAQNDPIHLQHIEEKTLECNICHIRFKRSTDLPIHLKTHSGEQVYQCDICQRLFANNQGLQKHLRMHKMGGDKPYKCGICQNSFTERSSLIKHVNNHSGEKRFQCNVCHRSFNIKCNLKRHLRIHNDEKSHVCHICQHRCNEKGDLAKHYRTHTKERPYECNTCKKRFSYNSSLRAHEKTHEPTGEKQYVCHICQHSFFKKEDLKNHIRIHTGEKPFKCSICNHSFRRPNDLKVHFRTHTNEKPFICDVCQQRFVRQSDLKVHLREHTGDRPFECSNCKRQFVADSTLQRHIANYHSNAS